MLNNKRIHKAILITFVILSPFLFIKGCGSYYLEADKEDMAHYFEYKTGSILSDEVKNKLSKSINADTLIKDKKITFDSLNSSYIIAGSSKIVPVDLGIGDKGFITVEKVNYTLIIKIKNNMLAFTYTDVSPVLVNDEDRHSLTFDSSDLHRSAHKVFEKVFKSITGKIKK